MRTQVVEATSVANYLDRYYKPERRGPRLLEMYEADLVEFGHVCTSPHDNVTGAFIFWPYKPDYYRLCVECLLPCAVGNTSNTCYHCQRGNRR
jgi:hypothetical protein